MRDTHSLFSVLSARERAVEKERYLIKQTEVDIFFSSYKHFRERMYPRSSSSKMPNLK